MRDLVGLADAIVGPGSEINYWGLSYGTYLGMVFAHRMARIHSDVLRALTDSRYSPSAVFPERVGRVILDGVIDATRIATAQSYLVSNTRI